jgi:capsule biosynthesis phosphatase
MVLMSGNVNIKKIYGEYQKTICIDFDGTINYWQYPEVGKPQPKVIEALKSIKKMGYKIIISSCRTNLQLNPKTYEEQVKIIEDYLNKNDIPYDEIDTGRNGKPIAEIYIDDRAIYFDENNGGWDAVLWEVAKRDKGG